MWLDLIEPCLDVVRLAWICLVAVMLERVGFALVHFRAQPEVVVA